MIDRFYAAATVLIITGIVMLCQPVSATVHIWGFPVLLAGVAFFLVLDHRPESLRLAKRRTNDNL
jgi:hypothetical protein